MAVCYHIPCKVLVDKKMEKKAIGEAAGISNSLVAKRGNNEKVTVDGLVSICFALNCGIDDLMELGSNDRQAV